MIGKITGRVDSIHDDEVIIDVHGIGYAVHTTLRVASSLLDGSVVTLFIYTHVREDCIQLLGFIDLEEKHAFKLLHSVSGVGIKLALSILNTFDVEALYEIINSRNAALLKSVSGLGIKIAERIILELSGKFRNFRSTKTRIDNDAVNGLIALGMTAQEAMRLAITAVHMGNSTTEDIIKQALSLRNNA